MEECIGVLQQLKNKSIAKIATALPLSEKSPTGEGVEVSFIVAPDDEAERTDWFRFIWNIWLKKKLRTGEYVPSPKVELVDGGLGSLNKGLDQLRAGMSGAKIVLEV